MHFYFQNNTHEHVDESQLPAAARLRLRNARDRGERMSMADETIQEIIDKGNARRNEVSYQTVVSSKGAWS